MCFPLKIISCLRSVKIHDTVSFHSLTTFSHQNLNILPFLKFISNFQCLQLVEIQLRSHFHHRTGVQISSIILIHGNVWWKMASHSDCIIINLLVCAISHFIDQPLCMTLGIPNHIFVSVLMCFGAHKH
jgi:hypothetical protein